MVLKIFFNFFYFWNWPAFSEKATIKNYRRLLNFNMQSKHSSAHLKMPKVCSARIWKARSSYMTSQKFDFQDFLLFYNIQVSCFKHGYVTPRKSLWNFDSKSRTASRFSINARSDFKQSHVTYTWYTPV